jgi:hypothetical protein
MGLIMTHKLEMLKGVLQRVLGDGSRNADFREALGDGIYSCQFETDSPLTQWFRAWLTNEPCEQKEDLEYQHGVQFVADEWNKILSEDNL